MFIVVSFGKGRMGEMRRFINVFCVGSCDIVSAFSQIPDDTDISATTSEPNLLGYFYFIPHFEHLET